MEKYSDWYEETADLIERSVSINGDLREILSNKRKFGLEKYKDISFQISKENSLNVNIKKHAQEELEDFINYLVHMAIVRKLNGVEDYISNELADMIDTANALYYKLYKVSLK